MTLGPGLKVIIFFPAQLQLLIKTKMLKNKDFSCFQTLMRSIYPAY